jgi:glucose-6-phosphate isomerase
LPVALSILNDNQRERTAELAACFETEGVLERMRSVMGLGASELPTDDPLVALGVETDGAGAITKNAFGPFDLARQAAQHAEWPQVIAAEIEGIRDRMREAHGTTIRFLVWAGMGGSMEDKLVYLACGLLRGGPRFYALDSTDPAKLKNILHDMHERSQLATPELLKSTLVVGMAMGMTSYEPVVNLEKLALLYEKNEVNPAANILCLTLPGSLLDQFAAQRGLTRLPLQLDGRNTTAGRHSSPLTRGSLLPLALAGVPLESWFAATNLAEADIQTAWKLATFLEAQGRAGRDKITLLLPKSWSGAALWTKQDFEESLGKSEQIGIKIVIGERVKTRYYRKPGDPRQDRCFLAVQLRGEPHPDAESLTELRHQTYPLAMLTFPRKTPIAAWMQFVHYVVFGLAWLRKMNFVTQPSVELYKAIASEIFHHSSSEAWAEIVAAQERWTPQTYAAALREAIRAGAVYAELTFFGDTRYSEQAERLRKLLDTVADRVFRVPLKMPVDIYEGPAMNHSYHEMIIGHGGCFSTLISSAKQARFPAVKYEPDYHMAQFAATRIALERRGRAVVPLLVKDLEDASLDSLETFFREVTASLTSRI